MADVPSSLGGLTDQERELLRQPRAHPRERDEGSADE